MVCLLLVLVIQALWGEAATEQANGPVAGSPGSVVSVQAGSGKVEVFHEGRWSAICGQEWDNRDAQVVCRMEGFWYGHGLAGLEPAGPADLTLLDHLACTGQEESIDQCPFDGWGQQACPLRQVAAVNCTPSGTVQARLVAGYGPWEGRLEVDGEGGWRPVCHHGFDDLDAQVVCRMLGLRSHGGKAHVEQKFPQSSLPPLLHQLDCTGHETNIAHCKGKRAGTQENCTNVGVECYNCGGLYVDSAGTVQSQNYPLSYPGNLNCLYVIQPSNGQQLYTLEFANFSTEACCDTLEVQVLTENSVLSVGTKYSGTNSPPRFLGKAFALTFLTDGSHTMQGFQATWSPARVQDVTSVTCESGHFRIDIDLSRLKHLWPESSPLSIALADPRCTGTVLTTEGQGQHLVIQSPTDSCGTRIETRDSVIVYHNLVVDRVFAEGSSLIVRQRRWQIPIQCQVNRTDSFQIHYSPFPDLRVREAEAATAAHARQEREVRGSLVVELDFPITVTAYKDRTYTTLDTTPLSRRLGDDIDLRVEMTGGDLDLKMVLQNCSARPEPDSRTTYDLIRKGCPTDKQTEILHHRQHSTDFRFTAFEFAGDFPNVYLTCDVRVCPANENSAECTQRCGGTSTPLIGKRSASEAASYGHGRSEWHSVTFGPIVLEN